MRLDSQADPASAAPGGKVLLRMAGRIDPGWHLYSMSTAGGIPTSFQVGPDPVVERSRSCNPRPNAPSTPTSIPIPRPTKATSPSCSKWNSRRTPRAGAVELAVSARYQTCNHSCACRPKWTARRP